MPYFKKYGIPVFYLYFDDNTPLVNFQRILVNILLGYVDCTVIFVSLFEVAILVFQAR